MSKELLAIIPARGGSKGIPRKNLHVLAGKPLIQYTIEAALASSAVTRLVVSTDDADIADFSRERGAEIPQLRPKELANDSSPTRDALLHMLDYLEIQENYRPDAVLTLQPTSPLRTAKHIDEAASKFFLHPEADSLVSVVKVPHNMTPYCVMKKNETDWLELFINQENSIYQRQDKPVFYARNGAAIYITRTHFLKKNAVFGGKLLAYEMKAEESYDIDEGEDLLKVEAEIIKRS